MAIVFAGCSPSLQPDMNKTVTETNSPPVNLAKEIERANREKKLLLLEFGSSDACPPCVLFQQKVFSSPEFLNYEKLNLVFVRLDFPLKHDLPPDTKATNEILAQQFEINPFPTFITLDKSGKEFWRMPEKTNVNPGTPLILFQPTNFISLIESVRAKEK